MNRIFMFAMIFLISVFSCKENKQPHTKLTLADEHLLDSIRIKSDTTYIKKYPRTDLVSAEYFENRKDSSVTQIMRDAHSVIRQVIIVKNKTRVYTASFYKNGQLMATYKLDTYGQYDGYAEEYYENGSMKRSGFYKGGLLIGEWKNFDSTGTKVSSSFYDPDGRQVK